MDESIEPLDFAILKYVADRHSGAWKARIHSHIEEEHGEYPLITEVAAQTIGRHVDTLVERGYLSPSFVAPDDVDQTYVTGFTISEEGREALDAARSQILEDRIAPSADALKEEEDIVAEANVERQALINLIQDEFNIETDTPPHELLAELDLEEMLVFLATFYFRQHMRQATGKLSEAAIRNMTELVENAPELEREFDRICGLCQFTDDTTVPQEPLH